MGMESSHNEPTLSDDGLYRPISFAFFEFHDHHDMRAEMAGFSITMRAQSTGPVTPQSNPTMSDIWAIQSDSNARMSSRTPGMELQELARRTTANTQTAPPILPRSPRQRRNLQIKPLRLPRARPRQQHLHLRRRALPPLPPHTVLLPIPLPRKSRPTRRQRSRDARIAPPHRQGRYLQTQGVCFFASHVCAGYMAGRVQQVALQQWGCEDGRCDG
jgi:hypothetical protein